MNLERALITTILKIDFYLNILKTEEIHLIEKLNLDSSVEKKLRELAEKGPHGLYIPSGALWGAEDIQKMAERGSLGNLTITMAKHPLSLKLDSPLKEKIDAYLQSTNENGKQFPII